MRKRSWYKCSVKKGKNSVDYKVHGSGEGRDMANKTVYESSDKVRDMIGGPTPKSRVIEEIDRLLESL